MPQEIEAYVFPDPVEKAISFLSRYFEDVYGREPDTFPFESDRPLIIVQDGGGSGVRSEAYMNSRLTFDVRSGDRGTASDRAGEVDALLREWQFLDSSVINLDASDRPKYFPDADRRLPAYVWTLGFSFRGLSKIIQPLSQ